MFRARSNVYSIMLLSCAECWKMGQSQQLTLTMKSDCRMSLLHFDGVVRLEGLVNWFLDNLDKC
jgi:hypothetical protein